MPKTPPTPEDIERFNEAAQEFAEREGLELEEAQKQLADLLKNLKQRPLEIFTLQLGFEDLLARVEALEAKIPS